MLNIITELLKKKRNKKKRPHITAHTHTLIHHIISYNIIYNCALHKLGKSLAGAKWLCSSLQKDHVRFLLHLA